MLNVFREEQPNSSGVIETSGKSQYSVSPYWIASAYKSGMLLFFLPPPSMLAATG